MGHSLVMARQDLYSTPIQRRHARQSEIPSCFADATLAASIKTADTEAQRAAASKALRQASCLVARGELTADQIADCHQVLARAGQAMRGAA